MYTPTIYFMRPSADPVIYFIQAARPIQQHITHDYNTENIEYSKQ